MNTFTSIIMSAVIAGVMIGTTGAVPQSVPLSQSPPASTPGRATLATPSVHFTASGDFSSGRKAASVLDQIGSIAPDLHLALGDLSYGDPGEEPEWCDFVTSRTGADFPFQLIAGSHESNGQDGHIDRFAECLPNRLPGLVGQYARQYYVDVPRQDPLVRFIMISPSLSFGEGSWSYDEGSPRYRWTENAIDSARDSGVPWVVVGMHEPCLSVGRYSCDQGPDLLNLLLKKRVDLVLAGHEHLYSRSRQLALSTSCTRVVPGTYAAECVSDGDSDMRKKAGTVFGIVGTGGVKLRDVNANDPEAPYFAAWSGLNVEPSWGNLDVVVRDESLTARFRPIPGSEFTDSFTITNTAGEDPDVLARDSFSRTVSGGFGTANEGGAWSTAGSEWRYSVDGAGHVVLSQTGERSEAYLSGVAARAADVRVTVSANQATPPGTAFALSGRRIPGAGAYQAKLEVAGPDELQLSLVRVGPSGEGEVVLQSAVPVPKVTPRADDDIEVRLQVVGVNPTVVRAKVWEAGTAQPSAWLRSATDATPVLQRTGGAGFSAYAPDAWTTSRAIVTVDNFRVVVPD